MHQILFQMGLCPRPRLGAKLTALPRLHSWIKGGGGTSKRREWKGGKEKGRGRKGKGRQGKGKKGKEREGGNVSFHHLLLSNLTTAYSHLS